MNQNSYDENQPQLINILDSDNDESTSLPSSQITSYFPVNNQQVNNLSNSEDKISNVNYTNNSELIVENDNIHKTSFSPDDNLAKSWDSSSGNEDDNVEYKLIEKNLNNSSISETKFNLFFKKNLNNENQSNIVDENEDIYKNFEKFNSVLMSETNNGFECEHKFSLIIDDNDNEPSSYANSIHKKVNINHDDDFIEEDFVPLNVLDNKDFSKSYKENNFEEHKQINIISSIQSVDNNENYEQSNEDKKEVSKVECSSFVKSFDNEIQESSKSDEEHENLNEKNTVTSQETNLKFKSASSIEDNNSAKNTTTLETFENLELIIDELKYENTCFTKACIWSETEAIMQQHDQVGASACGTTSILNILKALKFQFDYETVCGQVKVNQRVPESMASVTNLSQYLHSRSIAGMNSLELIENIEKVTENKITGRFFSFYPPRAVNLTQWLIYWIQKGAIPSALLNLQKLSIWGFIPDAWHHQMIYACDSDCIYLTNPLEIKSVEDIMKELTSESVLLVRSADVIKRFNANNVNLIDLLKMNGCSSKEKQKWFDINVIGQCVNVLREFKSKTQYEISTQSPIEVNQINNELDSTNTLDNNTLEPLDNTNQQDLNTFLSLIHSNHHQLSPSKSLSQKNFQHIVQPASYVPGITLFAYKDSNLFKEIMSANEIPMLSSHKNFKSK